MQERWSRCTAPRFTTCLLCAEGQYQSLQKLLETFSSYSARAPNRHLRPACRPDSPANARMWWQYAGAVARRQVRSQSFNWRQFERVSQAPTMHCTDGKTLGQRSSITHIHDPGEPLQDVEAEVVTHL